MSEEKRTEKLDIPKDDLSGEIWLRSGSKFIITLTELKGVLWVCLYSEVGKEKLKGVAYKVRGPKGEAFEGKTDDSGVFRHEDVSIGDFEITVEGKFRAFAPSLLNPSAPHEHVVKGFFFDETQADEKVGADDYEDSEGLGSDLIATQAATSDGEDTNNGDPAIQSDED
jgi:hypothetical protein